MSSEPSTEYLVAIFKGEHKAEAVWRELKQDKQRADPIQELALIRKSPAQEVSINEPGEWGLGRGAALGGLVGALAGVILGPAALAAGAVGAAIGGLTARLYDTGFDNRDLKTLSEALTPDSSALLLAAGREHLISFREQLERDGAAVVADALQPGLGGEAGGEFEGFLNTLKNVAADGLQAGGGATPIERAEAGRAEIKRRDIGVFKTGV
ncbi:MAG: DUF1269 domain-containing protein [Anaerolineae bacterium]|nr:DUF1269 domain-containing protein [Anaerolineae bacterium]MCZ7553456.1 DUF1269 domain-containing protein [Anaerolineales bacterium]